MRLSALALSLALLIGSVMVPAPVQAGSKKPKDSVVMLAFEAKWCGACQKMKPTLSKLERKGYVVVHLDVDTPKGKRLAAKYNVKSLPTYVVLDKSGHEQGRASGVVSEGILLGLFKIARALLIFGIKVLLF